MSAVCHSIIEQLAEAHGAPYDSFPSTMLRYGHGGVGGHGSICGAANGGACAIGLFHADKEKRDGLIGALLTWYEGADLPAYLPGPAEAEPFPRSAAHSVLCHVSVARWCRLAKAEPDGPRRSERCRRLSADVAAKTVDLLNRAAAGTFAGPVPDPATGACIACHKKPGQRQRTVKTNMHCASCHKPTLDHPD